MGFTEFDIKTILNILGLPIQGLNQRPLAQQPGLTLDQSAVFSVLSPGFGIGDIFRPWQPLIDIFFNKIKLDGGGLPRCQSIFYTSRYKDGFENLTSLAPMYGLIGRKGPQ